MASLTLQINSLAALERLLGGETQLEIGLRHSVVQAFAEKHLKAIAKDPGFSARTKAISEQVSESLTKQVRETVDRHLGTVIQDRWDGRKIGIKLHPPVQQDLETKACDAVRAAIDAAVTKSQDTWLPKIEASVQSRIDRNIEALVNQRVDARVKEVLAKLAS